MPNIKLRDGSGVETTYNNVDTITVPLADGSGTFRYGLTDEELTFRGDLSYLNYGNHNKAFLPQFQDRITFEDITKFEHAFENCPETLDLSQFHIYSAYTNGTTGMSVEGCVDNSYSMPYFHGTIAGTNFIIYSFRGALSPTTYVARLADVSSITNRTNGGSISQLKFTPYGSSGPNSNANSKAVRDLTGLAEFYEDKFQDVDQTCYIMTLASASHLYFLDTLAIPVYHKIYDKLSVYSGMGFSIGDCWHLKDALFLTNNGTPYKLKTKDTTLNFASGTIGYGHDFTSDLGDKKVYDAITYETWKNDPDWFAFGSTRVSYVNKSGSTVRITQQLGYSRYDHDSAVRTINTLPDTTDTGTNIITFKSYQGAFTDGGAIENLTEAEIAVAVSKGWNVGFNTSTT